MARKIEKREQRKPKFRIVGAGITEFWYIKHLKTLLGLDCELHPRVFGNESIIAINKFIEEAQRDEIHVICLFDDDTSQWNPTESQRIQQLHQNYDSNESVLLCDSMPSIEYWFLLHYEKTNRYFGTSKAVIEQLRHYQPQFDKSTRFLQNVRWVINLISEGRMEIAMNRAEQLGFTGASYTHIPLGLKKLLDKKTNSQKSK